MTNALTTYGNNAITNPGNINADMFNDFIAYLDVAQKSIETYTKAIKNFSRYLADNGITQPTRTDILAYKEYLTADHKATTINLYIIATRLFFEWTAVNGLYPNVAEHIKGKRITREPKKDALTIDQVREILQSIDTSTAQGLRDYAIISTAITCGLRTIEIARLKIGDVRQNGNGLYLDVIGKGRDDKEAVNLPLQTYKAILNYLSTRADANDMNAPLFVSTSNKNPGGELTTRSVSRIIKNTFINCGYDTERLTAHSCRHTAVTLALLNNEDIQHVQKMARHQNITTTLIYAHNLENAKNTCTQTVANAIFS